MKRWTPHKKQLFTFEGLTNIRTEHFAFMTKTLAIILNHNLPQYTEWLYYWIKQYKDDSFDLVVMDNGSKPEFVSPFATIRLEKNIYWGGALNYAFNLVLKDPQYDSLLFLNNDIELTPEIFVPTLRTAMFEHDLAIVSPCIAGKQQPWRQMQNWGCQSPRVVKWIDNQAPLIHRRVIEAIGQFPDELQIGWGQELVCYEVCRDHNWKIAVLDYLSILHYGKQTLLQNRLFNDAKDEGAADNIVSWEEYKAEAMRARDAYFAKNPFKYETMEEHVQWALKYTYTPTPSDDTKNKQTGIEAMKPSRGLFGLFNRK